MNDCWNRIGVWGDRSCAELTKSVHCRNCPSYSEAARDLFDREVGADYLDAAAEQARTVSSRKTLGTRSALIFRLGVEWVAIDSSLLDSISEKRLVHSLPHRRQKELLGLVNVRGALLVCVSLHRLLGIDEAVPPRETRQLVPGRLLVTSRGNERLVFPVDEIHGIHHYDEAELGVLPANLENATVRHSRATLNWNEKTVGLLDTDRLFEALNKCLA